MKKRDKIPAPQPVEPTPIPAPPRRELPIGDRTLFLILFTLFAVFVFREVLAPGRILFTTDDNIGALANRKFPMPHAFFGWWDDSILIGHPGLLSVTWSNLLLWLLPVNFFSNWIHAIDLAVASFCLCLFLRLRRLHPAACVLGGLTAFWLGSTFFLVYAGHLGKFGAVMFAALYMWLSEKAVLTKSPAYAILAGGAMGGLILEQVDVGFFFAMVLGLWTVYSIIREYGWNVKLLTRLLVPVVFFFAVLSYQPIMAAMGSFALDKKEANVQDAQENWEYCTQWSWPPEETIDFIAPGYTGWRSGEPDGPYWGRMGRSAGWETTKQGFQNFRLESFYLGAIPLVFAVWALLLVTLRRDTDAAMRRDVWTWSIIALVTYLLALGKFFPLYALFYHLPGMSSIRNPVKFMQVTQLALAVLAAFGLDTWLKHAPAMADQAASRKLVRRFAVAVLILGALFLVWASGMSSSPEKTANRFTAEGWGGAGQVIAMTMIAALQHASIITLVVGAAFALIAFVPAMRARKTMVLLAWLLVGCAALDQLSIAPRYVRTVDSTGFISENAVVKFLRQELKGQRSYILSQNDFYNLWLTYTFPYYNFSTFNVTQIRMTDDYKNFLTAMNGQIFKLWQASAVNYIIGPGNALQQLQSDPRAKDKFNVAFAFNAYPSMGGGVDVVPGTQSSPGQHGILRYNVPAARYQLVSGWQVLSDEAALRLLPSDDYKLFSRVIVSEGTGKDLPASDSEGPIGSAEITSYRSGHVELNVSGERPAILRAAEKFDSNWKAYVDGKEAQILRCDYIFQGVFVPAGIHHVVFNYALPSGSFWVEMAGLAACLGALVTVLPRRRATRPEPAAELPSSPSP